MRKWGNRKQQGGVHTTEKFGVRKSTGRGTREGGVVDVRHRPGPELPLGLSWLA